MGKKYLYLRNELLNGKKDGDVMSYAQLIKQYTDNNIILNNDIITKTLEVGYWDIYNGTDYDEEGDYSIDVYQCFIIDRTDAERLAEDTDELIYYNEDLSLYLLGVTHFGTSWDIVPTDYIITTDFKVYDTQEEGSKTE